MSTKVLTILFKDVNVPSQSLHTEHAFSAQLQYHMHLNISVLGIPHPKLFYFAEEGNEKNTDAEEQFAEEQMLKMLKNIMYPLCKISFPGSATISSLITDKIGLKSHC